MRKIFLLPPQIGFSSRYTVNESRFLGGKDAIRNKEVNPRCKINP